jgi:hypothetical protein
MRVSEKISLRFVATLTHKLIVFLLGLNLVALAILPSLVKSIIRIELGSGYASIFMDKKMFYFFLVILYLAGIFAFLILNELRKLLKSCLTDNIFVDENVKRLLRMAVESFLISLIFIAKVFVVNSIMTMVVVFVFFMASVFCLVVSLLFDQAVHYKKDVDLTI